ncbi:MAG TPA: hypothetical protein VLT90_12950 [Terriglobales bacterium]|nr:hypothetical protein [Terriglobales bacterium]
MSITYIPIRSLDPRLKRHICHDSRSWNYSLPTDGMTLQDKTWAMYMNDGKLDQGNVGACTAETADELLASDPLFDTLDLATQQGVTSGAQDWPLAFYHDETADDDISGTYPPNDTGSDALGMAKAALARGLISGYQHTFTAEDALLGLSNVGPFGWGTLWKTGMDNVDVDTGQVKYSGAVRGGHEISAYRIDVTNERVWCHNHWGAWGYQNGGTFWISFADFEKSLADQGDVVFFTPRTSPAPTPQPPAPPAPTSPLAIAAKTLNPWSAEHHLGENARAAAAWKKYYKTVVAS